MLSIRNTCFGPLLCQIGFLTSILRVQLRREALIPSRSHRIRDRYTRREMQLKSRRMKMSDAWCHSVGLYLCPLSMSTANEMFAGARSPTPVHRRIKAVFCHGSTCIGTRSSYTSFVDTTCGIFLFGSPTTRVMFALLHLRDERPQADLDPSTGVYSL